MDFQTIALIIVCLCFLPTAIVVSLHLLTLFVVVPCAIVGRFVYSMCKRNEPKKWEG